MPFAVRWYGTRFPTQFVEPMKCRLSRWESWSTPSGVGDAEVHRLAGLFRERVEMLVRKLDERDVGLGSLGEAKEDRPGPHGRTVAVALEEPLSLERGEEPRRRALGQLAGPGKLADAERSRALDHAHEQLRGAVDCLTSGHNPYYGTTVPPSASQSTLRGSAACS